MVIEGRLSSNVFCEHFRRAQDKQNSVRNELVFINDNIYYDMYCGEQPMLLHHELPRQMYDFIKNHFSLDRNDYIRIEFNTTNNGNPILPSIRIEVVMAASTLANTMLDKYNTYAGNAECISYLRKIVKRFGLIDGQPKHRYCYWYQNAAKIERGLMPSFEKYKQDLINQLGAAV